MIARPIGAAFGLGVVLIAWLGCARPPDRPAPVPAAPIDLEPRCDDAITPLPPLRPVPAFVAEAPVRAPGILPGDARLFVAPPSRAGLEILDWGFPLPAPSDPDAGAAPLAAALLADAETTRDPEDFRRRALEIGGAIDARVEGRWLWLEMRYPEPRRADALRLVRDWLEPRPARPDAFVQTRREVALARLASEAAASTLAARAFRRIHPPPPGALDPDLLTGSDSDATPERVTELLRAVLQVDGSVLLHAGRTRAADVRLALDPLVSSVLARRPSAASTAVLREDDARRDDGATRDASASVTAPAGPGEIAIVDRPDAPQVELLVGWPTVGPEAPDYADLEAWASLLGGNVGGRLFRDLRERQGLAYIIDAEQSIEGRFVVSTRARHERVAALVRGIEAHLEALASVPLETCEVAMLANRIRGEADLLADDARAWIARSRADVAVLGHPRAAPRPEALDLRPLRIRLEAVAARHLRGAPTVVLVGDADWLRRDLATAYPGRTIHVIDLAEPAD